MRRIAKSELTLVNAPNDAATLFKELKRASLQTTTKGCRRRGYILTCYFDLYAIQKFAAQLARILTSTGASLEGFTVAVDVGEWIRCRLSHTHLAQEIAKAARLLPSDVDVVPVQFPGRLLHAKAYASIGPAVGIKARRGFVSVTSGNATGRGLGLSESSNVELSTILQDQGSLDAFMRIMERLTARRVSPDTALSQDEYLRALALFSRGAFYHKWQGSLASEVRFKLTLTNAGKEARQRDQRTFASYRADSESMSRDPLSIQDIFEDTPRPFPEAFWRTFAVDTLLGYWLPEPVAAVADRVLKKHVQPYVDAIMSRTSPSTVEAMVAELERDVREYSTKGYVEEGPSAVRSWRQRVNRFRGSHDLLRIRLHPYERLPHDVLAGESRTTVRRTYDMLKDQLVSKTFARGTRRVLKDFLVRKISVPDLETAFEELALGAEKQLSLHERHDP